MQNISYEEYIRSILGYPPMNQNIYSNYNNKLSPYLRDI